MKKMIIALLLCICLLPVQALAAEELEAVANNPLPQRGVLTYTISCEAEDEASEQVLSGLPFWILNGEATFVIRYDIKSESALKSNVEITFKESGEETEDHSAIYLDWDAAASRLLYIARYDDKDFYEYYDLTGQNEVEKEILDNFEIESAINAKEVYGMVSNLSKQVKDCNLSKDTYYGVARGKDGEQLLQALNTELLYLLSNSQSNESAKKEIESHIAEVYKSLEGIRVLDEKEGIATAFTMEDKKLFKKVSFVAGLDVDVKKLSEIIGSDFGGLDSAKGKLSITVAYEPLKNDIIYPELTAENSLNALAPEEKPVETPSNGLSAGWNVMINGNPVDMKYAPYVENDRAMVSGQVICHGLGVTYHYENGKLNVNNGQMEFVKGVNVCLVNGEEVALEATPEEVDGELFVPVRFLAENLGYAVGFRQEMTADGKNVYASIVLIDPKALQLQILMPEGSEQQKQIFDVAAAVVGGGEVNVIESKAGQHKEWSALVLASGDSTVIYSDGTDTLPENIDYDVLFYDLSAYIDQLAPQTKAMIDENEEIRNKVTSSSGAIIAFPVNYGGKTEFYYVPKAIDKPDRAVYFLHAYSEVAKALIIE